MPTLNCKSKGKRGFLRVGKVQKTIFKTVPTRTEREMEWERRKGHGCQLVKVARPLH